MYSMAVAGSGAGLFLANSTASAISSWYDLDRVQFSVGYFACGRHVTTETAKRLARCNIP